MTQQAQQNGAKDVDVDWKVFGAGSEAGKLLARLYGHDSKRGVDGVSYPKLKTNVQSTTEDRGEWKPCNGDKLEDKNVPVFNKSKALALKIPKVGKGRNNAVASDAIHGTTISKVQCLPRRKDQKSCEIDIQTNVMKNNAYRPPHRQPLCTDDEKKRLNEIFAFRGGNALPQELTNPVLETNILDLNMKVKEERRLEAMRRDNAKRNTIQKEKEANQTRALFDGIVSEIKERKEFQTSMDALGKGEATRSQMSQEISQRLAKLKEIDGKRANDIIRLLRSNEL